MKSNKPIYLTYTAGKANWIADNELPDKIKHWTSAYRYYRRIALCSGRVR